MARLRSPGYPSFPLAHVIELAKKIHDADRQHPVPREVAAQHMGFSGLTGASDRALSALMHYGLADKAAKGEIRVTDLALRIIHPESGSERREALHRAGFMPDLFSELRSRYPGQPPSSGVLASYLSRENFAPAAIPPAARAYLETCDFLLREGAYESDLSGDELGEDSLPLSRSEPMMNAPPPTPAPTMVAPPMAPARSVPAERSDVFTIGDDGEVIVTLPKSLTQEAYDDLKDWLELIIRKARRRVRQPTVDELLS
ncbi:MAG: hypothetical protein ACOY4K_07260 [Pseudomonadota bacterium]